MSPLFRRVQRPPLFKLLVSIRLGRFTEPSSVLPTTRLLIGKVLVPSCDALLCVTHTLQSSLESEQEDRNVQINFSAAI